MVACSNAKTQSGKDTERRTGRFLGHCMAINPGRLALDLQTLCVFAPLRLCVKMVPRILAPHAE